MSYNEPKVLGYLLANGEVYTVRHYPAGPPTVRPIRKGRTLIGRSVRIETVAELHMLEGRLDATPLEEFAAGSGFATSGDWLDAITRQHGNHLREGKRLWLLKATLLPEPGSTQTVL